MKVWALIRYKKAEHGYSVLMYDKLHWRIIYKAQQQASVMNCSIYGLAKRTCEVHAKIHEN